MRSPDKIRPVRAPRRIWRAFMSLACRDCLRHCRDPFSVQPCPLHMSLLT